MTNEEFLKDVCPNHTEKSKWNRSELLHILDMHKKQLPIADVVGRSEQLNCGDCDNYEEYDNGIKWCSNCGNKLS
ncbi:hypothetical protein Phi19:3_gp032 [Cellulophaga phage phi19:3]|uniref:Uncharacterized protein n=1 Tax=Cellulophaga phage phi19:3 TaxID=1327971 RepID=R9ZWF7_9CAUD|nr:hypothetical protein Phi19:3_gp032 [Cellulophaga phage phi19:3]AGO47436.1 hypothetical protein Phi19:3_gp032 [Cellulophaga phage phi19:3]